MPQSSDTINQRTDHRSTVESFSKVQPPMKSVAKKLRLKYVEFRKITPDSYIWCLDSLGYFLA